MGGALYNIIPKNSVENPFEFRRPTKARQQGALVNVLGRQVRLLEPAIQLLGRKENSNNTTCLNDDAPPTTLRQPQYEAGSEDKWDPNEVTNREEVHNGRKGSQDNDGNQK